MVDFAKLARTMEEKRASRKANPRPLVAVVNAKTPISEWPILSTHYIGRSMRGNALYKGSPLANPFKVGRDGSREVVVSKYNDWLKSKYRDKDSEEYRELMIILEYSLSLHGISLVCWCAPKKCHGDVIKKAILHMWSKGVRPEGWTTDKGYAPKRAGRRHSQVKIWL